MAHAAAEGRRGGLRLRRSETPMWAAAGGEGSLPLRSEEEQQAAAVAATKESQERRERGVLIAQIAAHYRHLHLDLPPGLEDPKVPIEHLRRHWGNLRPDPPPALADSTAREARYEVFPSFGFF